jgi:hypothetical protein
MNVILDRRGQYPCASATRTTRTNSCYYKLLRTVLLVTRMRKRMRMVDQGHGQGKMALQLCVRPRFGVGFNKIAKPSQGLVKGLTEQRTTD